MAVLPEMIDVTDKLWGWVESAGIVCVKIIFVYIHLITHG